MKKAATVIAVMLLALLPALEPLPASSAAVMIDLLNPPPGGVLQLEVGESYTFDVQVASDQTFILAIAQVDSFFPGAGIRTPGAATAHQTTSALLQLTVTAKASTADLPDGVNPSAVVVGVRFQGGLVVTERFEFDVLVP